MSCLTLDCIALVVLIVVIVGGVYVAKTVILPKLKQPRAIIVKRKKKRLGTKSAKSRTVPKVIQSKKHFAPHIVIAHKRALIELILGLVILITLYYLISGYWTQIISLGTWLIPIIVFIISVIVILIFAFKKKKAILI